MKNGVSVIIPTFNGGQIFSECLEMIGRQVYDGPIQLIVVDSGSTDGTIEAAKRAGALVRKIDKGAFHHARTRNLAVSLAAFDKVIFMVQDAVPCSDRWLSGMVRGLEEDGAAAAFAAHVPHAEATPYARFEIESIAAARRDASAAEEVRSFESFQQMPYERAYRSVGLDNVCAVYRKELLESTPFPDVDFAEDLAWAVKIALLGHRIVYLPHIQIRHSHNRSPEYAFRRQIVNSYWVAGIMRRTMEDLSDLSLTDLMSVALSMRSFLLRMIKEGRYGLKGLEGEVLFMDRLLKHYPLMHRIGMRAGDLFFSRHSGRASSGAKRMAQQAEADMACQLGMIMNGYPPKDRDEWVRTVEQVAANILGRIHGEVYAAGVLKGRVSRRLDEFIRPFFSGV
ncbi:MAG: glycosyltransferase [Deltaproteobacteria bacterium]|nr:glycosyltransferase [Deltaproteobacteria bacterium]